MTKDTLEDILTERVKLNCIVKAHQSILEISLAEKNWHLIEQTRIPLKIIIEKIWCRQKKSTLEKFMQISVPADMKSTKKPFSNKNPEINPFVAKSLLESNCKRFRKSAIRGNFNLKPETEMKKLIGTNDSTFFTNTAEMKGSCIQFSSFMFYQLLSTRFQRCLYLEKVKSVFQSLQASNTFPT